MPTNNERTLLVESDPEICDLIYRQALQPLGYQVLVVSDASKAIQQVIKFTLDLIISKIKLLGKRGKDLMEALSSHGLQTPLIVNVEKEQENNVIQANRPGSCDYPLRRVREAYQCVLKSIETVNQPLTQSEIGE
jgi:DNA-binding response OmpR family regulator